MSSFKQKIPHASPNSFQYIVEKRGGYDEWSDEYNAVVEISFPDGSTFKNKGVFDDKFETSEGWPLTVEFPRRPEGDISVQQYEPSYSCWNISSIKKFTNAIEQGKIQQI